MGVFKIKNYLKFIDYLFSNNIKIQRFPLCMKDLGECMSGEKIKPAFLENLSKVQSGQCLCLYNKSSTEKTISTIRNFNVNS